jgi:acyl-CoA synthetase (NDP forming)
MIQQALLSPNSIVVVGASNDVRKPGGRVLQHLLERGFEGNICVVNPKESTVQGLASYPVVQSVPPVELAILAIPAKAVLEASRILLRDNMTKVLIVLSAGFGESGVTGRALEEELCTMVNERSATLIGPNTIGIMTGAYCGLFTKPIPPCDPGGCNLISASGATACFIMELGIPMGLRFANIFAVGNSAQTGIEEVLEYLDAQFDSAKDPVVQMLYIEKIRDPQKLLRHASSLAAKGCILVAIKSGTTEAGIRAAASHTGAMTTPDVAVDALFRKAGITRCHGRQELVYTAAAALIPKPRGRRVAIVTHAGGPGVMLSDALTVSGFEIPKLPEHISKSLQARLYPGSSVSNPVDFLATGTPDQFACILDSLIPLDDIDAIGVIFGTPGLTPIFEAYDVLHQRIGQKPIYPIFPSPLTAHEEVRQFIDKGHVCFWDETELARALGRLIPDSFGMIDGRARVADVRELQKIRSCLSDRWLSSAECRRLLDASGIPRVPETEVSSLEEAVVAAANAGYPVVAKMSGSGHKTQMGGVVRDIRDRNMLLTAYELLREKSPSILIQKMATGLEVFIGVKFETGYGHVISFGLGGTALEVLNDVTFELAPLSALQVTRMIRGLNSYPLLKGYRGQPGLDEHIVAETLLAVSNLVGVLPEIREMDMNPLIGREDSLFCCDVRIRC